MEEGQTVEQRALRVSQLDASELDRELLDLLSSQFKNIFKYFRPSLWVTLGPEIRGSLRYLLWLYTVRRSGASVGQHLLQLRYKSAAPTAATASMNWMTSKQKTAIGLLTVVGPWLQERATDLALLTRNVPYMNIFWDLLYQSEGVWKLASLMNFLVFLRQGYYQFLYERVVGIRAVHPQQMGVRQVSFEYMDREMLWHGFAEFLFFILPLVNLRKVKNFVSAHLLSYIGNAAEMKRTQQHLEECAVCGDWPTTPHQMGCCHVFCYVCIYGNYMADPAFVCPLCGHKVQELGSIQPVIIRKTLQDASKDK